MDWIFVDEKTIKEKQTGYILHLVSGSWQDPLEVKPEIPKTSKFLRHTELLKRGLEFAFDREREAKSESA